MAATAWQLYNKAKQYIGNGTITLGAGVFKMLLATSASNASTFTLTAYSQIQVKFQLQVVMQQAVKT